jgi:hypothetical protein
MYRWWLKREKGKTGWKRIKFGEAINKNHLRKPFGISETDFYFPRSSLSTQRISNKSSCPLCLRGKPFGISETDFYFPRSSLSTQRISNNSSCPLCLCGKPFGISETDFYFPRSSLSTQRISNKSSCPLSFVGNLRHQRNGFLFPTELTKFTKEKFFVLFVGKLSTFFLWKKTLSLVHKIKIL